MTVSLVERKANINLNTTATQTVTFASVSAGDVIVLLLEQYLGDTVTWTVSGLGTTGWTIDYTLGSPRHGVAVITASASGSFTITPSSTWRGGYVAYQLQGVSNAYVVESVYRDGTVLGAGTVTGPSMSAGAGQFVVGWGTVRLGNAGGYSFFGTYDPATGWTANRAGGLYSYAGDAYRIPTSTATHQLTDTGGANQYRLTQIVVGAASGTVPHGTGTGAFQWAGSGTGVKHPHATGSGTYTFTGAGTGHATRHGTGSGAFAWAGSGTGYAPPVGLQQGIGTGTFGWTGAGVGTKQVNGTGTGTFGWTGTGTGTTPGTGTGTATGTGTFGWTGTGTGDDTDPKPWTVDLIGRALVGVRTTTTDLYVPPAPATPPAGVSPVVLLRNSHQQPAPTPDHPVYAPGEYPNVVETVGVPHVWLDGVDRSYTSDGLLLDADNLVSEKGFGDRSAGVTVNTMQIWDRPGFGLWDWLDVGAQVEVGLVRPDGTRHVWWAGDLISNDATLTASETGSSFDASWLAQGPMVQLTQAMHQPLDRMDPTDIGVVIAREVNAVISKRYPPVKPVITGIRTTKLGSIRQSVAERVRDLLATAWVGNRQWGLVRSEDNPRQYVIALTDTTTIHWTVTAGTHGVSAQLSEDWSQVTNVVYGSGTLANGHRWMNRRYPYLLPYKPPAYFSADTSAELLLGSTDADTINKGVTLYTQRLRELGYRVPLSSVMLDVHVSATRNLQAKRGLTVDGRVGGQTWTSVWSIGATGADLRSVRLPLAADPRVEPWLYLPNGDIAEANPDYVPEWPRLEVDLDYGENTTLAQGTQDAQQRVDRLKDPAVVGSLTLATCPWEGSRWEMQPGQNVLVKGWRGRDVLLHIADVRINRRSGTVTLTVDSAFRDALTVHEVRKRNAESKGDPGRKPGALGRTRSGAAPDMTTPFDGDSPAGIVPELTIRGGKWTVWPVAVDRVGTLARIFANTYDPVSRFGLLLFGMEVMPNQLNAGVGNILTQSRPWSSASVQAFLDSHGFIDGWGQQGQACGYGYGSEQDKDPVNGEFYATPGVNYISAQPPFLWLCVLAEHDCRFTAELDPKAWL